MLRVFWRCRPIDIRVPDSFDPEDSTSPPGVKWPWVVCRMVLAFYQADLAELWSVLPISHNGMYSDIKYLVPKSDFASFKKFSRTESLADKGRTEEQALTV